MELDRVPEVRHDDSHRCEDILVFEESRSFPPEPGDARPDKDDVAKPMDERCGTRREGLSFLMDRHLFTLRLDSPDAHPMGPGSTAASTEAGPTVLETP